MYLDGTVVFEKGNIDGRAEVCERSDRKSLVASIPVCLEVTVVASFSIKRIRRSDRYFCDSALLTAHFPCAQAREMEFKPCHVSTFEQKKKSCRQKPSIVTLRSLRKRENGV